MSVSQFVSCFLCKLPLILRVGRKWKGLAGDNCKKTLNIEFEQDLSVGLGATLGADRKLNNIFLVTRIFPGKADSAIFLGFECTISPQYLMKFVWAIFEKMKILISFLMCTTLNFEGRSKTKNKLEIFARGLQISNLKITLCERQKIKNYFSSFKDFSGKSR